MLADDMLAGASAAADFCALPRRAIYRLVERERIPFVRMGRNLYFRKSELAQAFASDAGANK